MVGGSALTMSGTGTGNTLSGRTVQIDAGATLNITGNVEQDPGTNVIDNAGTLNLSGTAIRHAFNGQGALTLNNAGTINKTGAGVFLLGSTPVGEFVTFNNSGTLNVNAGTFSYVGGSGSSTGTVNVLAGANWETSGAAAMNFVLGSTFASAGNILTSGGTASFLMPTANFTQTGNVVTSGGTVSFTPDVNVPQINLSGGVTNFAGAATTPSFTQTGGSLGGAGTLTLTGAANSWNGTIGSWTGGGSVVLVAGSALTMSGTGAGNTLAGRTLTIQAGATAEVSGNIELDPGTNLIDNAGTLNLSGTAIRHAAGSQGALTLANSGVVNKSGTGSFVLGSTPLAEHVALTNTGTINVNAGTLSYVGGSGTSNGAVNVLAGATWETGGLAAIDFDAGSTFASAGTILTSGGVASFLMPTANFTQTGNIVTSGGSISFVPDVNVPQIDLSGGSTSFLASATTPAFTHTGGSLGGNGTLTLSGAANSWSGTAGSWTGVGSVVLLGGSTLTMSGTGAGNTLSGRTLTVNAGATLNVSGNVELDPGSNVINNAGTMNLSGTAIRHAIGSQGALSLTNSGTINKVGAGTFVIGSLPLAENIALNNSGTINVNAGTLSYAGGNGTSSATVNVLAGATWATGSGATMNFGVGSTFTSAGTILTNGGAANFLMPTANFTQTGNIVTSGGIASFVPDVNVPQISLSGGIARFNGAATTPLLTQSGGLLGGTGTLTLTGTGNTWSGPGATWGEGGTVVLASGATLTASATGLGNTLSGRTVIVQSGATLNVTGNIELEPGANLLSNAGTLNLSGTAIRHLVGAQGSLTLANTGTINMSGVGTFFIGSAPVAEHVSFNNSGTINVLAGTLDHVGGVLTQTGTVDIAGGATLAKPGGFTNQGLVRGAGTINVGAGSTLANSGTLHPGGSGLAATLSVAGNFVNQSTGSLEAEIGGFTPGTQYDVLAVSGDVTLGGTLDAPLINGFIPAGQSFDLITRRAISGNFAIINESAGLNRAIVGTAFRLTASGGACVGICWDGGAGTSFWSDAANWTGDALPGAADFVTLDLVSGVIVDHVNGTTSILGLQSSPNNHLVVSGGSLTLSSAATVSSLSGDLTLTGTGAFASLGTLNAGTVNLDGGSVINSGSFNAAVLNQSGGTFSGAGALTVSSDFNQSGGSFAPTGNLDLTRSLGNFVMGPLATSGTIRLATLGVNDLLLAGDLVATNAGLGAAAVAIELDSARDVLVGSTTNLATVGSGAIGIRAARDVDLKVDDGGNNTVQTSFAAAGNLDIAAIAGEIRRSDADLADLSAIDVTLSAAADIANPGAIAASGDLSVTVGGAFNAGGVELVGNRFSYVDTTGDLLATGVNAPTVVFNALVGDVILSGGANFSGNVETAGSGSTVVSGGVVTINGSLAPANPLNISGGGTLSLGAASTVGNLQVSNATLTGAGSLSATGTADLTNATITLDFASQGTTGVSGSNLVSGVRFGQEAGTLTLQPGAVLDVAGGNFDWQGGRIAGSGAISVSTGGSVSISGSGARQLDGPALAVDAFAPVGGTMDVRSGTLTLVNPSTIASASTLTVSGGTLVAAASLDNAGTLDVTAGSAQLLGGGVHSGTFRAAAGAAIDFSGGTHLLGDGSTLAGPGTFAHGGGALQLGGSTTGTTVAADANLNLDTLAFGGTGRLSNFGTVTAGAGLLVPGDFVNQPGGVANFTGTSLGGNLLNSGDINVTGNVSVAGTQIDHLGGTIVVPSGATLNMTSPSATFRWFDGTISGVGLLDFSGGGTFQFAGTGDRVIDGINLAFSNLTLPNGSLTVRSGSLTLAGTTSIPTGVDLNLEGSGLFVNNSALNVAGNFSLAGGAFAGSGAVNMTGGSMSVPTTSSVAWINTGLLTNTGTLALASGTITNTIDNQGTINLGGTATFAQAVTNTGTLRSNSGSSNFQGGLTQTSGVLELNGGGVQGNVAINGGTVRGSGALSGDLVVGNATFSPGFSPGAVTVTGNFTMSAGSVLTIELGGLAQGTGFDYVNVLGTANLAGTLNVTGFGGYIPAAGDAYPFMNFANSTGAFSTINLPAGLGINFNSFANLLELRMPAGSVGLPPSVLQQPQLLQTVSLTVNADGTISIGQGQYSSVGDPDVLLATLVGDFGIVEDERPRRSDCQ